MAEGGLLERLRLGMEIAAGLEHMHEHFLLHRDVKPDNVLLETDGTAKLCDLGLARGELRPHTHSRDSGSPHPNPHASCPWARPHAALFRAVHSQRFSNPDGPRLGTPLSLRVRLSAVSPFPRPLTLRRAPRRLRSRSAQAAYP